MSTLPVFKLEDYLSKKEFNCKYFLSSSDLESRPISSLLVTKKDQESFLNLNLGYTTTQGCEEIRTILAKDYQPCSFDDILSFAGAEEGIYATMRSFLKKDDHVIVMTPGYESHQTLPASICQWSPWELKLNHENNWELDLDTLKKKIQKNTKMIIVNFPHNPTGFIPTPQCFNELIAIARNYGIYIFCDEVYWGIEHDISYRLQPVAALYEKGISLNVMSKSYGLAGLRYGWIACQDNTFIKQLANYKHYLSICNSKPSELLTLLALKQRDQILKENNQLVSSNLNIVRQYFEHSTLFQWFEPKGSPIAYPKYLGKIPIKRLSEILFDNYDLLLIPCHVFGQHHNHFRVSYGKNDTPKALNVFAKAIECLETKS